MTLYDTVNVRPSLVGFRFTIYTDGGGAIGAVCKGAYPSSASFLSRTTSPTF